MRQHRAFSEAVLVSTYFNKHGEYAITEVLKDFHDPFPAINFYQHAARHMKPNLEHWRRVFKVLPPSAMVKKKLQAKDLVKQTMEVIDEPTLSQAAHEQALDEFIAKGREKLDYGNLPITATTFIQAIKTKAEMENKTKDRRYDALKQLFAGAAPKEKDAGMGRD